MGNNQEVVYTKFELKTFTNPIILVFFLLVGYLEGGWLGLVTGGILYGIALTSILVSLIPFFGTFIWWNSFMFFANNLNSFIPVSDLIYKITWVVGIISGFICVTTSILTVLVVYFYFKFRKPNLTVTPISTSIDTIIQSFPTGILKGLNLSVLGDFVNKIIEQIVTLWKKLNQKLIGSILVFLGIGIASHDFWWESEVSGSGTSRPTHGAYEGLQISIVGMQIIVADLPLGEQIRKCLLGYLGVGICYIGFFLMQFIPKGISRIVNHIFWWSGIALLVYNWYTLMEKDIVTRSKVLTKRKKQP